MRFFTNIMLVDVNVFFRWVGWSVTVSRACSALAKMPLGNARSCKSLEEMLLAPGVALMNTVYLDAILGSPKQYVCWEHPQR